MYEELRVDNDIAQDEVNAVITILNYLIDADQEMKVKDLVELNKLYLQEQYDMCNGKKDDIAVLRYHAWISKWRLDNRRSK